MNKFLKYTAIAFLLVSCSKPSDKIRKVILYNDSVGYWNYEWPRDRAEFYGFTFKLGKDGKVTKYSYDKVENKRRMFGGYEDLVVPYTWGVANDSTFTLMNYNSQIKITKYNHDTIWLYDKEDKTNEMLIKVKGNLNIEK